LAYIISLAGMAIPGDSLLRMQRYLLSKAMGMPEEDIAKSQKVMDDITNIVKKYPSDFILQNIDSLVNAVSPDSLKANANANASFKQAFKQLMIPEIKSFINYNPAEALSKIKCPVFALGGEKDLQVPADINLNRIRTSVKGPVTTKKYSRMNHLFQDCTTGLPNEYGSIEETISPNVLMDIVEWIKQVVR